VARVISMEMKNIHRLSPVARYVCLVFCLFISCGIEDYQYIEPVKADDVTGTLNNHVEFTTPDNISVTLDFQSSAIPGITSGSLGLFFSNYDLYYRIYISNVIIASIAEENLSQINSTLYSDYYAIKPYTVDTNNNASGVGTIFTSRKYWKISDASGPALLRAKELITPYPDSDPDKRYFFNDPDLVNTAYLNSDNNADVVASTSGGSTSTYVSMYVVHTKFDPQTLTQLYSSPTWLGVFLLPDTVNLRDISINKITAGDGDNSTPTTKLTITLGENINLIANDIVIDNTDNLGFTKGDLTNSGSGNYELTITQNFTNNYAIPCETKAVNISLSHTGYKFTPSSVTADIYIRPPYSITADGSASTPTTKLTISLGNDIDNLSADDIVIDNTGSLGITKGDFTGSGHEYELAITSDYTGAVKKQAANISLSRYTFTPSTTDIYIRQQ